MTSTVWNYIVKENNDSGRCRLCNKTLQTKGNTTNLRQHIMRKHKIDLDVQMDEETDENNRKRKKVRLTYEFLCWFVT